MIIAKFNDTFERRESYIQVLIQDIYFTKRTSFNFYAKTVSLHATRFFFTPPAFV